MLCMRFLYLIVLASFLPTLSWAEVEAAKNIDKVYNPSEDVLASIIFPDTLYRYPTRTRCEGTPCACNYGTWQLLKPAIVYATAGDTSNAIAQLSVGDSLVAHQGWMYVDQPGVVVVHTAYRHISPGDTLFVMQHIGETTYRVWYKNSLTETGAFWSGDDYFGTPNPRGHQILKPKQSWWISFTTSSIPSGWLRVTEDETLDGPDRNCPQFRLR